MVKVVRGIIRGRIIELSEDLGLTEGQQVEVRVDVVAAPEPVHVPRPWGEGLLRSAGALAADWTDEDDRILEQLERDRHRPSTREIPD
ncbi:hypothetical protein OJF2_06020 [Aquisphaera giovannonii]|uniref:Uncharacterized protein n=1 Tax=Aquisphaera giovannonii TaxID=406548 RepID=A0A5B9VUR5_9BACT|nr:hypothetical protein [Aquisphaera giovannonii]QEH32133.1 hypothetical protein OJF2_06020 [Aquisphaera giovannonii]